jgi:uncharacterized protein
LIFAASFPAMTQITEKLDWSLPTDILAEFSRRWRVRELALFGSILRDDFGPESDLDVLISFQENAPWTLWDLTTMADDLTALFGRRVDLVEREALRNPFRRDEILRTARIIYVSP